MAHTRGGGYGNMAGSDDRTLEELVAELRERVVMGGGYADVAGDELERLITEVRASAVDDCVQAIEGLATAYRRENDWRIGFQAIALMRAASDHKTLKRPENGGAA